MQIGDTISRAGCVTLFKFLAGSTLSELEQRIGYHSGRLAQGVFFARFKGGQSVQPADVQLLGYSQVAEHHYEAQYGSIVKQYDLVQLTKIALGSWQEEGFHNIVKVFPLIGHDTTMDNDVQYPPGKGIPQWKLKRPFDFEVTKFVGIGDRLTF